MASVEKTVPTSADVAMLAIRIQDKLEHATEMLTQAGEDADDLREMVESAPSDVVRFRHALIDEAGYLARYLSDDHGGSEFVIPDAVKSVQEFLELLGYATRKDG